MATLLPEGKQSFNNSAGAPLIGGKVYTYDAGTSTPRATYQDAAGTVPNTNPVVLDARGEATIFWTGSYKVVLKDASDATIWTVDNVVDSSQQTTTLRTDLAAPTGASLVGATWFGGVVSTLSQLATSTGSSLLGFLQAGAGVIARSVQSKLRERVSILDFGAVGDDATDNLAAFNAAAAYIAASTKGVNLYVPSGTYRLSNTVTFPNSKSFTIYGDGDASCIRINAGSGGPILLVGSASIFSTRQVIKDLFFQGPVTGTTNALRLLNCNTVRVEGCVFQSQVTGIQLDSCYAAELTSNVFDVCTSYGVISPTTSCHNLIAKRNNFFTCGVGVGGQAIAILIASDNLSIEDNDFEYCNVALRLNNCTAVSFRGNYAEYCANSIFDFLGTNREIIIDENWLALGTLSATISNVTGGSLKNNTIYNQTVGTAASCADFVVGRNYKYGTGTLGQSSWATPALSGTFAAQSGYFLAQYIKREDNQVQLRGNILAGAAGSLVFTLPVGYRPSNTCTFATASSAGPGTSIVEVRSNGDVWCIARDASGGTGLNGVSFDALN